MYNIAIVEDSLDIRRELSDYFNDSDRINCVLVVDTVEKFIKFHRDFMEIDLVLLDIILYNKSGIEGIPMIRQRLPLAEIVMFSVLEDKEAVLQAVCYGATGFLNKDLSPTELENKLAHLLDTRSGSLLSLKAAKNLIEYFQSPAIFTAMDLSEQELGIMRMLADGFSYQAIADTLSLTLNGVRYHIKNIYRTLNINSRQELKTFLNKPRNL